MATATPCSTACFGCSRIDRNQDSPVLKCANRLEKFLDCIQKNVSILLPTVFYTIGLPMRVLATAHTAFVDTSKSIQKYWNREFATKWEMVSHLPAANLRYAAPATTRPLQIGRPPRLPEIDTRCYCHSNDERGANQDNECDASNIMTSRTLEHPVLSQ